MLHLNTSKSDPAFVAASLSATWDSITPAVINDLEKPVLSLERQRCVAAELTRLDETASTSRVLAGAAERAAAAILDVVRFGGGAR